MPPSAIEPHGPAPTPATAVTRRPRPRSVVQSVTDIFRALAAEDPPIGKAGSARLRPWRRYQEIPCPAETGNHRAIESRNKALPSLVKLRRGNASESPERQNASYVLHYYFVYVSRRKRNFRVSAPRARKASSRKGASRCAAVAVDCSALAAPRTEVCS